MAKGKKTTVQRVAVDYTKKSFGQAPTAADLLNVPSMMKPPKPSPPAPQGGTPPAKEKPKPKQDG